MPAELTLPPSGADRAALAFSALSKPSADTLNRRLSIVERMRLREGLSRVREATEEQRLAAVGVLAREVRRGTEWPRPSVHDDTDCPFGILATHPTARVVDVLDRTARREPLEVAVTLCHLHADLRAGLWEGMSEDVRNVVIPVLDDVHGVSPVRTRAYARDVVARLVRAVRHTG